MMTSVVAHPVPARGVVAWRRRPFRRDLLLIAALLPLGVAAQAVWGGLTVIFDLAPGWVIMHFLLSMLLLVACVALGVAGDVRAGRAAARARPGEHVVGPGAAARRVRVADGRHDRDRRRPARRRRGHRRRRRADHLARAGRDAQLGDRAPLDDGDRPRARGRGVWFLVRRRDKRPAARSAR